MGHGTWSDSDFDRRQVDRKTKGTTAFTHSDNVTKTLPRDQWEVHPKLNPKGITRESRDSINHPESRSVAVIFDVTGSMGSCPRAFQKGLPKLMGLLLQKRWLEHPQILFGAVGDATCDRMPLQVGQYESDIAMEDTLTHFVLEGCGGGQGMESYGLPIYMASRHFSMDCFEKRKKKGYLFLTGDERPWPFVRANEVASVIGDSISEDIPIQTIIQEAQEKYHIFMIRPTATDWGLDPEVQQEWESLLGKEHVVRLEHAEALTEMVALIIGLTEGKITLEEGVREISNLGEATLPKNVIDSLARSLEAVEVAPKAKTPAVAPKETTKKKPGRVWDK